MNRMTTVNCIGGVPEGTRLTLELARALYDQWELNGFKEINHNHVRHICEEFDEKGKQE